MHVLAGEVRSLDDSVQAVDLGQTPADVVFLSFSDSDLGLIADAHAALGPQAPGLRLASLSALRHPYSVDLYLEKTATRARLVLVRCLGGLDYWRYGIEQLAAAARTHGFALAVVPGDGRADARLAEASTVEAAALDRLHGWFEAGGPDNARSLLGWVAGHLGRSGPAVEDPRPLPAFACAPQACPCGGACRLDSAAPQRPVALVVFYRSLLMAGDVAPVRALCQALEAAGLDAVPVHVTSLKDPAAADPLAAAIDRLGPAVIINTTGFSARRDDGTCVLDRSGAPVLQAPIATTFAAAWQDGNRGLSAADLAMNVVLPEIDGRVIGPAISFKDESGRDEVRQTTRIAHRPHPAGIARVADMAAALLRLQRTARADRRLAIVLSDYPAKGGRTGYAVGLDGPASLAAIAGDLHAAGYATGALPPPATLIRILEAGGDGLTLALDDYRRLFADLPDDFRAPVLAAWGEPEADALAVGGAFRFRAIRAGNLLLAVQPDRGHRENRAADHHAPDLAPTHGYIAFYLALAHRFDHHAMVHLGTHGTLEWLPGKAVALSSSCAPFVLAGAAPILYPFIVNNPGEAAQARRRIAALPVGHLTPPLVAAGTHGVTAEIEGLLDEFAAAQSLDARRARRIADLILTRAAESGLAAETGLSPDLDPAEALARLDAFVCDLKDMRIGDGLHVWGRAPDPGLIAESAAAAGADPDRYRSLVIASAAAERQALLDGLDGRRLDPGPAGAPTRGRLDVLPTGRVLHAIDPRAVPTRTACDIGAAVAEEVIATYLAEHGDYPRRIVLDLWGSATMRTGGDDLGQALALIGARPTWEAASGRVTGFEILTPAALGRPRVDVTLRISGLFRDVFPAQVALFDAAARAVAARDEAPGDNPLAEDRDTPRVFGAAPGRYGVGLAHLVATGAYEGRDDLAAAYLDASAHAFAADGSSTPAPEAFRARVAGADAYVHVQDLAGQDVLDSGAFAEHEGGFAAASGGRAALYHVDATRAAPTVRTVKAEIARVVRARATNPRWLAGQMRHGHRGAAEIAETVLNLVAFAASADLVAARQFEAVFDATLGDDRVRDFMVATNPAAAAACARSFDEALRRGLWQTRRNSVAGRIAETLERAA